MNTAYPLFPVTIITFLAYLTTRIFVWWEIIPLRYHRKFWNYILLIAFLVSGLSGLLSVVKVNYKLEIAGYETYLQWHVAMGIALVFIAIFHFGWHLKYYFSFRRKPVREKTEEAGTSAAGKDEYRVLLFLLGMTAVINQVVFIREFLSVLSGNELVVGIVLAAWMLLTAWGARYARKGSFISLSLRKGLRILAAITISPMVLIALLYILKYMMFPPGTVVNIGTSVVAAFLLLFPVCFLSGYLFTAFSAGFSAAGNANLTSRSYAIESMGSLLGGVLFSVLLGRFFTSFQVFGFSAAIILLSGAWIMRLKEKQTSLALLISGLLVPAMILALNPEKFIKKLSYPNQELISSRSTRYGNLVITRQADQINVYEDNTLQFYTDNVMVNEEAVHFAMVQHKEPKQVLLISGGIGGMISEIMKYDVDRITYLESNPEIFRILENITDPFPDSGKVQIIKKDIRSFIAGTGGIYDVILINLPPPSSLGINRFYTEEFYRLLKRHCNQTTIISTSLPSTANYAEENALQANSSLWKTLGSEFKNRMIITGEKNYFLASDAPLSSAITERIAENNIPATYVNRYYLDDMLLAMRSETLISRFSSSVPVNRDFYPFLFTKQIGHWLSYFGARFRLLILIPAGLFLLFFFRTDKITAGLYTGGFTAASLEVTLLLAYQVYFGSIYLTTALFFAVFMAGLAIGSSRQFRTGQAEIKSYYALQFLLAVFAVLLPFLILLGGKMTALPAVARILFLLLIFILATGIGYEFFLASGLRQKSYSETSGVNYSTDLAGSAIGAFLTAIVLLPMIGLIYSCFLVAALNIFSGLLAFSARRSVG